MAEVADFAVPSDFPGGEDDMMPAIVPEHGHVLDGGGLGAQADALQAQALARLASRSTDVAVKPKQKRTL